MKNILLKSFDGPYCKEIIGEAFKGMPLGTVLNILEDKKQFPDLDAKDHRWISAKPIRESEYGDVDWNTISPIDEELIENMRPCEAVFLMMVGRHVFKKTKGQELSYRERKRQYLQALRYWNHVLETESIDLFLSNHVPHQGYDIVIYELCKLKGIRTLFLDRFAESDTFWVGEDWEKSIEEIVPKYEELQQHYSNTDEKIELSPQFEVYAKTHEKDEQPWYFQENRVEILKHKGFISRWKSTVLDLLLKKPATLIRLLLSPSIWKKKLTQHSILSYYDAVAQRNPDLTKPFIYVPLHMQPEASTCPKGGAFADQELIVELLAGCIPKGVSLYVKEHPNQTDFMRSKQFYKDLMDIPSVTLIAKEVDSYQLIANTKAIATVAGSAGLEGMFRKTPVLMFGHWFYQFAPGVHPISSKEDCTKALDLIFAGKGKPSDRETRIFLKAMEECGGATITCERKGEDPRFTFDERAIIMGKFIAEKLRVR